MHRSSYLRMEWLVNNYVPFLMKGKETIKILDIGSFDANGTYRAVFDDPIYQYTGMDMVAGPNVNIVPRNIYQWDEIADEAFDLVISGQVFEHIEYPWVTIREVARVLKPSGFCILIAPSAGWEHKAPKDCYRYYADGLTALAKWADLKVQHVSVGGAPETDHPDDWKNDWNDTCLVAQKAPYGVNCELEPFVRESRVPVYGYYDIYWLWKTAVRRACTCFECEKPLVLFGAGAIGSTVLNILGKDMVRFFVDNSQDKVGKQYQGVKVISSDEYLTVNNQYNCLITASYKASVQIRAELEKAGATCQILYEDLQTGQTGRCEYATF